MKKNLIDNRTFWDERYTKGEWLGSGPGSRGYAKAFKRSLMDQVIRRNGINSIADVGCGDLCWIDGSEADYLDDIDYTGYDISQVLIARNRSRYPGLKFELFDIVGQALPEPADLLVCFDVLIHQVEKEKFRLSLKNLLDSMADHALISYRTQNSTKEDLSLLHLPGMKEEERQFRELIERKKREKAGSEKRNKLINTANHGDLSFHITDIRPELKSRVIASYRYQTIYEITRDEWLEIELPEGKSYS